MGWDVTQAQEIAHQTLEGGAQPSPWDPRAAFSGCVPGFGIWFQSTLKFTLHRETSAGAERKKTKKNEKGWKN